MKTQEIRIEDYNYSLPDERIAKFPLPKRDESKLLLYRNGEISESIFKHITDYLPQNSLMVFNNTRVIQARLLFQKETGARIEIFCLEPIEPHDYALIFQETRRCSWTCLVGNLKKWKEGTLSKTIFIKDQPVVLTADKKKSHGDTHLIEFTWDNETYTFADILDAAGVLPIPPYLHRETEKSDLQTYQTVYSKIKGSVAAPTAGLHFTENLLARIDARGIERMEITLHVGGGTFLPVKVEDTRDHVMHAEFGIITPEKAERLNRARQEGRRIVSIGTTALRLLESAADEKGVIHPFHQETSIFITPGYRFRAVDALFTNFHLPCSTLFMLVSAFCGTECMKSAYAHAVERKYRFFSYGDACFLDKGE